MASPFGVLLKNNFKAWLSVKGILLLLAAAAFPAILSGAWAVTHQADLVAEPPTWQPEDISAGQNITFTGVVRNEGRFAAGAFNATLVVGPIQGERIILQNEEEINVDGLGPGEQREITLTWTARAGTYGAFVLADSDNDIGEIEEFNNFEIETFVVQEGEEAPENAPTSPGNLTGTSGASTSGDVNVTNLTWEPTTIPPQTRVTYTATVRNEGPSDLTNVSVTIEVGRNFQGTGFFATFETNEAVDIASGEEATVQHEVASLSRGSYWARAYANVTDEQSDPNGENNHLAVPFVVNPTPAGDVDQPEIPERLTIKRFYLNVLFFHFWIVVPFIALFYAGGVLADDRNSGNLIYVLTRPIPRWMLPVSKFISAFVMGAIAVAIANVVAYLILFGFSAQGDIGFLTTPLFASLIAFFAYTALFTLLGVLFARPYIVGILYILFWEALGLFDTLLQQSDIDININVAPWVEKATIIFNLGSALGQWPLDEGVTWLPSAGAAIEALRNIMIAALVFLGLAAAVMHWREFDV